jgi:hypothetical protein
MSGLSFLFNVCCRSEVKMAQNHGDFIAKGCRAVMKYHFLKENLAKKKKDYMSITLNDKRPFYSTAKDCVARFRTGNLSTEDEERSGRPSQVIIPENVDAVHCMILDDRRIYCTDSDDIPRNSRLYCSRDFRHE